MDSVNAVKEGKVDLAFVSTDLQVNKPLRMKKLREYHEVLIGGSRYIELKRKKDFIGGAFGLSLDQPDFGGTDKKIPE